LFIPLCPEVNVNIMRYLDGGKAWRDLAGSLTEIVNIETSKVTQLPRIVNSKPRMDPAFMDVNFLAYVQKIDLKRLSVKTHQRGGGMWQDTLERTSYKGNRSMRPAERILRHPIWQVTWRKTCQ
jgi:hypothetical protein